jgi:hypothetical protein
MNREDEQWCNQLEMTKCNHNEYRCYYGGQCIPLAFLKDSKRSIDCLDGSDEQNFMSKNPMMNPDCSIVSTFRCQERIGRYPWSFQCGDGQYLISASIPNYRPKCTNKKDKELFKGRTSSKYRFRFHENNRGNISVLIILTRQNDIFCLIFFVNINKF